jgi:hypothetical protein
VVAVLALRHGVLSRCTVLPWEDWEELLTALVAEHAPRTDRGGLGPELLRMPRVRFLGGIAAGATQPECQLAISSLMQ